MNDPLGFVDAEIARLEERTLLRRPRVVDAVEGTVFCSNDYLGLGELPLEPESSSSSGGATASPLVVGYRRAHATAEHALAAWLGREATLLFSSGYAANLGTIAALVGPGDVVFSDALNHASIIDGCRLSGAKIEVYPHLDLDALASKIQMYPGNIRRLVVSESYFSMDADSPDLSRLRRLTADSGSIWMLDEAHALGAFGPAGAGLAAERGIQPDIVVGTLGKSFGLQGAFVAGSRSLRLYLWNRARSLVFSTGVSPAIASSVPGRLAAVVGGDAARARIHELSTRLRASLRSQGWRILGHGHVVPIALGRSSDAAALSARLLERGLVVQAIRPPTVPEGTARLRVSVTASHTPEQLDSLVAGLGRCRLED